MTWQLLTIRISHFNEKARWALDRCGHTYQEHGYAPILHMAGTVPVMLRHRAGRADRGSTRFSTPVLLADGRVLTDSSAIVAFASERAGDPSLDLYPSDAARELDAHFSGRFGADTRRVIYWYLLPDGALIDELADRNLGPTQARVQKLARPLLRAMLRRVLRVDEARAARSRADVISEFESVSARLADGRPYLTGDRFTAADLSFAALASLVLMIGRDDGYGAWLPPRERLPAEFVEYATRLRDTPAGQFALRMFAQERRRPA